MMKIINVDPGYTTTVGLVPASSNGPVGYDLRATTGTNHFVNVVNAQDKSYLELLLNPTTPMSLFPENFDPLNEVPSINFSFQLFPDTPSWFGHELIIYDEETNIVLYKGIINANNDGEIFDIQEALSEIGFIAKVIKDGGTIAFQLYNTQQNVRLITVFVHGVPIVNSFNSIPEDWENVVSLYDANFNVFPPQSLAEDPEKYVSGFSKKNLLAFELKSSASIIPEGAPYHKVVFHAPPVSILINDVVIEVAKLNNFPSTFETLYGNFTLTSVSSDDLNVQVPGEDTPNVFPEEYVGKGYRQITVVCETGFVEVRTSQAQGDVVDPIITLPTDVVPFNYTQLFNAYSGDANIRWNDIQNRVCVMSSYTCRLVPYYMLDATKGATDFIDVKFKDGKKFWISAYNFMITPEPVEATLENLQQMLGQGGVIVDNPPSTDPGWTLLGFKIDPNAPSMNPSQGQSLTLGFTEETGNTEPNIKVTLEPDQVELIGNQLQLAMLQVKDITPSCVPTDIDFGTNEPLPDTTTNIHMTIAMDDAEMVCKTTYQEGDTPDKAFERLIDDNPMAALAIRQQFIKRTPETGGGVNTYYQGVNIDSGLGIGNNPVEIQFRRNPVAGSYDLYNVLISSMDPSYVAHSCSWAVEGALSTAFVGGQPDIYSLGSYNEGRSVNRAYDPVNGKFFAYNPLVTPYPATAPVISGGSQSSGMYIYYIVGTPEGTPVNKEGMEAEIYMRNPMNNFDFIPLDSTSTNADLYIDRVAISYNAMAMKPNGADAHTYIVTSRGNVVHGLISNGKLNLIENVGPSEEAMTVSVNTYGNVAIVGTTIEPSDPKFGLVYSVYNIDQTTFGFKSDVYTVSGEWADPEADNTVTSEISWLDKDNFVYSTKTGIVLGTIDVAAKTLVGKFLVKPSDLKDQEIELGNLILLGNTFVLRANDKDHVGVNDTRLTLGIYDRNAKTLTLNTDFGMMYRTPVLVADNYRQFAKLGDEYILQLGVSGPNWFTALMLQNGFLVPAPSDLISTESIGPGPSGPGEPGPIIQA